MEEVWKEVKGYEGRYAISNFGRLMSHNYMNNGYDRVMVPKKNNSGRLYYELYKNGKSKTFLAHRLVGIHFIDNPNNYPEINHKDENPKNNRVDNLEWCDRMYNVHYSMNLHPERATKRKESSKWHDKNVVQMDEDLNIVRVFENVMSCAREMNYNAWSIIQCCNGIRKHAYGYKWRFAD